MDQVLCVRRWRGLFHPLTIKDDQGEEVDGGEGEDEDEEEGIEHTTAVDANEDFLEQFNH